MIKRICKDTRAVSTVVEFTLAALTITVAITLVIISIAAEWEIAPLNKHAELETHANEMMSLTLSSEPDAGLAIPPDEITPPSDSPFVTTTTTGPDLIPTVISCPSTADPYETINVRFEVENTETMRCDGFDYVISLGDTTSSDSVTTQICSGCAASTVTVDVSIVAPASAGWYTLTVWVGDPFKGDIDYDNNDDTYSIEVKSLNEPPPKPTGTTNLGTRLTDHTPGVSWNSVTDPNGDSVTYYVQSRDNVATWDADWSGSSTSCSLDANTWSDGEGGYWRVRAYDGQAYSDWALSSTGDYFKMNSKPTASVVSPSIGATGVLLSVTLDWRFSDNDDDSQSHYELEVDDNSDFSSKVIDIGSTASSATQYSISSGLSYGTKYYWRVKVRDGYEWSSWQGGSSWYFTTINYVKPTVSLCETIIGPDCTDTILYAQFGSGICRVVASPLREDAQHSDELGIDVLRFDVNPYFSSSLTSMPAESSDTPFYNIKLEKSVNNIEKSSIKTSYLGKKPGTFTGGTNEINYREMPMCFLKGTKIIMADGTQENIENIQPGDMVEAYDQKNDSFRKDKVIKCYHHHPGQMISDHYLVINKQIKITSEHLVYVNNKWIQAGDLTIGDPLVNGKIFSIEKIYKRMPSYNLELEKYHTYLAFSDNGMLIAHNGDYTWVLSGNEETTNSEQKSGTSDNPLRILKMESIKELQEKNYSEIKKLYNLPDHINFQLEIGNPDSAFCYIQPDNGLSPTNAKDVAQEKEIVLILYQPQADINIYIQAWVKITVF